jgi:hypothetical protein
MQNNEFSALFRIPTISQEIDLRQFSRILGVPVNGRD